MKYEGIKGIKMYKKRARPPPGERDSVRSLNTRLEPVPSRREQEPYP